MALAKLKKVDLREAWKHEASDFTRWLAEEENLRLLGNEVGFDIKLIETEASVGDFNVDILAEEEGTGRKIIIENQLEITNHDHLGKIVTYASGYDAEIVLWVVKDAREEHRRAVDWLNEHTDENTEFYLVKIEVWQIENSPLAPKFDIVSKPNDWAKTVKESTGRGERTETNLKQLEFWTQLKDYAKENGSTLRFQKPSAQHWLTLSVGSSQAHIALTIKSREKLFGVELYINNSKDLYKHLYKHRSDIEREIGETLEWMELPERKASRIKVSSSGDLNDFSKRGSYFPWLIGAAEKFKAVFPKYLNSYKEE